MLQILHWKFFYLVLLLVSVGGLTLADYRFRLVFFDKPKAALKTVLGLVTILIIGDIIGVTWLVHYTNPLYVSGIFLADIPIEEVLFLIMVSYFTLVCYTLIKRRLHV